MATYHSIAIIGAGNLAWHLAPELENAGHTITEVYSRDKKNAAALVKKLYNAEINTSLDFRQSEAGIIILAVADDAIEVLAPQIQLPATAILVHTSGAQPLDKLGFAGTPRVGVFYPLQTFSKAKKVVWPEIPILIESEDIYTANILYKIAKSISKNVQKISDEKRLAIHTAAVFSCNFPNFLMILAEEILRAKKLDFDLLKPLVAETFTKVLAIGPRQSLTGPAKRGDLETLDRHMAFLQKNEELTKVYRLISQMILDKNNY
ncbi:MAG: Rossmann-like and DUF2520 domain-containing protein [Cyclobacteriaceae bacterium]